MFAIPVVIVFGSVQKAIGSPVGGHSFWLYGNGAAGPPCTWVGSRLHANENAVWCWRLDRWSPAFCRSWSSATCKNDGAASDHQVVISTLKTQTNARQRQHHPGQLSKFKKRVRHGSSGGATNIIFLIMATARVRGRALRAYFVTEPFRRAATNGIERGARAERRKRFAAWRIAGSEPHCGAYPGSLRSG